MSSQNATLADHEPQSKAQAEEMIIYLKDEIARIQNQLNDPERRASMTEEEYEHWHKRAQMAVRYKKSAVRRLSLWNKNNDKRNLEQDSSLHHLMIGRALKLATKQYGRLIAVLMAAEDYINSPCEEEDEKRLARLIEKVMQAREIVRTEPESPAQSEIASTI